MVKKFEDGSGKGSTLKRPMCGAMGKGSKGQSWKTRANGHGNGKNGKGCEKTTEDHRGEGKWVTWEQEKENRGIMDVIQTVQSSTICSSCSSLVKDVF